MTQILRTLGAILGLSGPGPAPDLDPMAEAFKDRAGAMRGRPQGGSIPGSWHTRDLTPPWNSYDTAAAREARAVRASRRRSRWALERLARIEQRMWEMLSGFYDRRRGSTVRPEAVRS